MANEDTITETAPETAAEGTNQAGGWVHITKWPGVCSGRAAIDNTRVRVMNVVFLHKQGASVDEIREQYPILSPAQVHAALAYYYDHPDEIEASFREDDECEAENEAFMADWASRRP